jgi:hypothetical protein
MERVHEFHKAVSREYAVRHASAIYDLGTVSRAAIMGNYLVIYTTVRTKRTPGVIPLMMAPLLIALAVSRKTSWYVDIWLSPTFGICPAATESYLRTDRHYGYLVVPHRKMLALAGFVAHHDRRAWNEGLRFLNTMLSSPEGRQ